MKLVQFLNDAQACIGLLSESTIRVIGPADSFNTDDARGMCGMIQSWNSQQVQERIDAAINKGSQLHLADIDLLAPLTHPQKIICVGRNYAEHASEMGSQVGELPVIFNKFPSAIANPNSTITIPSISEAVDYEAELVVVIGRQGSQIPQAEAMDYVFGYCCGNDVSARDWQKGRPGGQWLLGKTFDHFAPIGPWIATKDEVDAGSLAISLKLNGDVMQQDNTANLIFGIGFLIAHVSKFATLRPGDLIFTGTPAGVGAGKKPPQFLKPGDETVVEISGLGKLSNTFEA